MKDEARTKAELYIEIAKNTHDKELRELLFSMAIDEIERIGKADDVGDDYNAPNYVEYCNECLSASENQTDRTKIYTSYLEHCRATKQTPYSRTQVYRYLRKKFRETFKNGRRLFYAEINGEKK